MSKEKKYEKDSNSGRFIGKREYDKGTGDFNNRSNPVVNTAPPPPPRKPSDKKDNE